MAETTKQKTFDGATLSTRLRLKDGAAAALPIGKGSAAAVARRYKHAAGKSNTYAPEVVDMIYRMAREGHFSDAEARAFVAAKLAAERERSGTPAPSNTWDQLVFLSANLTRLVIDPYREKCNSRVLIGAQRPRPLRLDWPVIFGGVDFARLPAQLLEYVAAAAQRAKLAVVVEADWPVQTCRRMVAVDVSRPPPDLGGAAAVLITAPHAAQLNRKTLAPLIQAVRRQTHAQIPVGVVAPAVGAAAVVDASIELDVDFYLADAQWTQDKRPTGVFAELTAAPALGVLADTVERLGHHCKEEAVQVIYQGGIRGGADAGKALCLGATAVTLGLAATLGMGFKLVKLSDEASLLKELTHPLDAEDAVRRTVNLAQSVNIELTMLARAAGKSDVNNMEPEDLRALTIATSAATGVPVAGKDYNFRKQC